MGADYAPSGFDSVFKDASGAARNVTDIASGYFYNCFALSDGAVKCISTPGYGSNFLNGEARFSGGRKAVKIDTSWGQSVCALLDDGAVVCWGRGFYGALGQASTNDIYYSSVASTPDVDLGANHTTKDICVGYMHACALLENGSVKCWGNNDYEQLGFGILPAPPPWVAGAPPPAYMAPPPPAGGPGEAPSWNTGDEPNEMGEELPALNLGTGVRVKSISCGSYFTCALLEGGSVKCWGMNRDGQLGYGHTNAIGHDVNEMGDNLPAVDLGTGRKATNVFLGSEHACATLDDASVKCWGAGSNFRLGRSSGNIGDDPGEMGDNLPTVDLGTFCGTNERVSDSNSCVTCPSGTTNPAGDNPQEYETTCTCGIDRHVHAGLCLPCPTGYERAVQDPVPGPETSCTAITCDASAAPSNGGIGNCTSSLASGSTCQPTCNSGYTVSGPSSCTAGTLSAATCSANACDASIAPTNGGVGDCASSLASGSTCQPTCNSGYTVSGPSSCTADTLTAATCSANACDASIAPTNGGVGDCASSLASGSTCQPTCNSGYTVSGPSSCTAGTLSAATCSANACDASIAPTNGGVGDCASSLASGSTCQPTCNSGYTVSGPSSCTAGTLSAATCSANACDASIAPTNGGVGDCASSLASGSTCQPTCNSGYTVSGPSSCTAGTLSAASCSCAAGYTRSNGECMESTEVEVKLEFAGITQVIDDALVQTLQNALTTSLLAGATGVQVNPADITMKYTMLGKQTFPSPVDESSFIAAAATSLGVATSDITNFAQSAARRRLLSNVVTYQVVTTNRTTLNAALATASSPITVGGVTGAGAAPTTTIAVEVTTAIPTSQASTITATLNDPSFTTSVATAASNAGVSGISISSPPCTGLTPPAAGGLGTCGSELASGSSCQPTCIDGYTVSGPTTCIAGALTAATCSRNSDSLFGGFISFVSPSPSARAVPRLWLASCVLAALLAP